MTRTSVAGVILAGGRSRRMGGGDKCLMQLGGAPILSHVIRRFSPQVSQTALNANGDPARFAFFGLPVIADRSPDFAGPLAGILAGLEWAAHMGAARLATVAADTPFLPLDLVAQMIATADAKDKIAVARSHGRLHPTFALWPVALRDELASFLASGRKARVTDFVTGHNWGAADFMLEPLPARHLDPFFNINTPEELHEAERVAELLE